MNLSRPSRVVAALVTLICMLTMQFAAASYVCPGMVAGSGNGSVVSGSSNQSMTRCEDMDMAQPVLCHAQAHDEASKQSLDKPGSPDIAPFVPAGLVLVAASIDPAAYRPATPATSLFLTRTTAPPIAIRHCCFRI
jgi:hypothetical protein